MVGSGTIINMAAIVIGGLLGLGGKQFIKERYQEALMKANGLCVIFIGIAGALQKIIYIDDEKLSTQGTFVLIGSFAIGTLLGEWIDLERHMERFGTWLKEKSGNSNDGGFLDGFLTASFTVCIGAMAIIGSLQDGISGDNTILVTKAILDFLIILIMTTSMGKGCIFAAIPVGIFQGTITLLARVISPFMTDLALDYISMTGSILIFCVGVNLIWKNTFKVANMLPVVLIAAVAGFLGF